MKTPEEFQSFYRSTLAHTVDGLEAERQKVKQMIYRAALIGGLALLVNLAYVILSDSPRQYVPIENRRQDVIVTEEVQDEPAHTSNSAGSLVPVIILIGALGYFFWVIPKTKEIKSRFKKEVIGGIVKFEDERLQYNPERGLSQTDFDQSKIFVSKYDRYQSEDLMSATIGKTVVRFSTVHTQRQERGDRDSDGGSDSEGNTLFPKWVTVFQGILFIADFNKQLNGRTVVVTDEAEKKFGSLGTMLQKMNRKRDPLIKMDDTQFESAFAVYGNDPVEAHYILSPAFMERIMAVKQKVGNIELSFVASEMFVSIPRYEKMLGASIFSSMPSYNQLEKFRQTLQLVVGMVEDLNLNNRIWSKA